jgi:hypothetical protein
MTPNDEHLLSAVDELAQLRRDLRLGKIELTEKDRARIKAKLDRLRTLARAE